MIQSIKKLGPDTDVQDCIDDLNKLNMDSEIIGIAVAMTLKNGETEQHVAGKYNRATMLGSVEFLKVLVMEKE